MFYICTKKTNFPDKKKCLQLPEKILSQTKRLMCFEYGSASF